MKVLVTGATGFVGQHLVPALLARGLEITATSRDAKKAKSFEWFNRVNYIPADIHAEGFDAEKTFGTHEWVAHLAWPGLPRYDELFHLEDNLPNDYRFLKKMITGGTKRLLITGTCLEYGIQNGPLAEDMTPMPTTPYGMAKDHLRHWLQQLQRKHPFSLRWARLFYMHGPGQNPASLLAKLDQAIADGLHEFDMSPGEQLRDFLPINEAAQILAQLLKTDGLDGIFNCCSGQPISVRRLVEQRLAERLSNMKLNLGVFPYPRYEALAFWGDRSRLEAALS